MKILIVYATQEGQTEKIARFMADELRKMGQRIDLQNVSDGIAEPRHYDAVIIGAPIHVQKFPAQLSAWVGRHSVEMSSMPSAFFSVCLGILEKNEETQTAERKIVEDFLSATGWRPRCWAIFAGALQYSKYGWLKRFIMKCIASRAGGDTDTSRDYEYTDWDQVRRFLGEFSKDLGKSGGHDAREREAMK